MTAAEVMDGEVVRRWLLLAADWLGRTRAAIDQLNVFPVPDADTGTNLHATMASAAAALAALPRAASQEQVWEAAVQAALNDACGNSGIIVSQLLRGLADACAPATPCDAGVVAAALADAAALARAAVWQPVEGTLLTVADAAASAALRSAGLAGPDAAAGPAPPPAAPAAGGLTSRPAPHPASAAVARWPSLAEVSRAAALGARQALLRTERQLDALAANGVVDAGGAGLCVVLDALCAAIDDSWPGSFDVPPPRNPVAARPAAGTDSPHAYEVTFMIEAAETAVRALAGRLGQLGDSLVVSGSEPAWHVHVHAADAGAVIETALSTGRPAKIKITFLNAPRHDIPPHQAASEPLAGADSRPGEPAGRRVVVVAEGSGLAGLLGDAGAVVVPPGQGAAAALAQLAAPGEPSTLIAQAELAAHWPAGWPFVEISAAIQAIAALAVHDPGRDAETDAAAMRRAVCGMRWASVASGAPPQNRDAGPALLQSTTAQAHRRGDLVPGRAAGPDGWVAAALAAATELTSTDTEILTILTGRAAPFGLGEQLAAQLACAVPGAEVICYDGGMTDVALLIGAE